MLWGEMDSIQGSRNMSYTALDLISKRKTMQDKYSPTDGIAHQVRGKEAVSCTSVTHCGDRCRKRRKWHAQGRILSRALDETSRVKSLGPPGTSQPSLRVIDTVAVLVAAKSGLKDAVAVCLSPCS